MISLIVNKLENLGMNYKLNKRNDGYWKFDISDSITYCADFILMFNLIEIEAIGEDFYALTFNCTVRYHSTFEELKNIIKNMEWEY